MEWGVRKTWRQKRVRLPTQIPDRAQFAGPWCQDAAEIMHLLENNYLGAIHTRFIDANGIFTTPIKPFLGLVTVEHSYLSSHLVVLLSIREINVIIFV